MEWIVAFTIFGLYGAQAFLVCAEFIKPTPTRARGGFSRRSYWAAGITPAQIATFDRHMEEYRKRCSSGEKVDWKQEGF